MDLRKAVVKMVSAVNGGWTVAAAHLGMTENALRNRVYETKGQTLSTHDKLALQELSGTTHFVEALAAASGGTFVRLPDIGQIGNDSVQIMFNEMYSQLGEHFKLFMAAIEDGVIDSVERTDIQAHGAELHRKVEQMQALMFSLYCRRTGTVKVGVAQEVEHV
jgi:hypothetical protein